MLVSWLHGELIAMKGGEFGAFRRLWRAKKGE